MDWITLIDKILTAIVLGMSLYFALRERIVKVEAEVLVLKKEVSEHKSENGMIFQELKSSIDNLNKTINKLEKSIVRLETRQGMEGM